ncbi:TlpA family protein disulfide reductase [Plantibacter sp. YIM 135249]|uniref:TlpA family protein disulfide reductase n=1 Tax=Plantibacter sp. YIM 135249 TaxID=3423918 RepID=UPI003D34770B
MNALGAIAVILALVVLATAIGLWWRAGNGRAATPRNEAVVTWSDLGTEQPFGTTGTVVQFSTRFCAKCPGTRRLLGELTRDRPGLEVVDVDLTHRADLADRFHILQTPTILLLDADGIVRTRIAGAPDRAVVTNALAELSPIRSA